MSPSECADNVTSVWWVDDVCWRWPLHNRLKSIGLMVSLFFVLQLTTTQPHIAHLSAIDGPLKVRPAGLPNHIPPVVSSAEARARLSWELALLERFEAPIDVAIELIEVRDSVPCDNFCSERHRAIIRKRIEDAYVEWRVRNHCPTKRNKQQPCY